MATFRVNQRVRIVNDLTDPDKYNGKQAIVVELYFGAWTNHVTGTIGNETSYSLAVDGMSFDREEVWVASELEPLIDSGRTVVAWEVGVSPWVPEHMRIGEEREKLTTLTNRDY